MKIINDSVDLAELQNKKLKVLLKKKENRKIISIMENEKVNNPNNLKKFRKLIAINNFVEFIIYLSIYFIFKCYSKETFFSLLCLVFCFMLILIQISLQIAKEISFRILRIIKYILFFNIYFYLIGLLAYYKHNPCSSDTENNNMILSYAIIFVILSNIFYFHLQFKNEIISFFLVQVCNLFMVIFSIKNYNLLIIGLLSFFSITVTVSVFRHKTIISNIIDLKFLIKKIINEMVELNFEILNENKIFQIIIKNDKVISSNLLEFQISGNNNLQNQFSKKEGKNKKFGKSKDLSNECSNAELIANSNILAKNKFEEKDNIYEILSNFILNNNQKKENEKNGRNDENETENECNMNIDLNKVSDEISNNNYKRVHFSKGKNRFVPSKKIPTSLFKNNIHDKNKKRNTIGPVFNEKEKYLNLSVINNKDINIQFIKKIPSDLSDSASNQYMKEEKNSFIQDKDLIDETQKNTSIGLKEFPSKFRTTINIRKVNSNLSFRSNLSNFKTKLNKTNNLEKEAEEKNTKLLKKHENETIIYEKNLLNVLKNLSGNLSKRYSQNFTTLNQNSINNNDWNGLICNLKDYETKNLKENEKNNFTSNCENLIENLSSEKYTFLGNFFKKDLNSDNLLKNRISYDVFYKTKSIDSNLYFDLILKNKNDVNDQMKSFSEISNRILNEESLKSTGIFKDNRITQFAKLIHEFKTPINSILGLIGNLESDIFDDNKKSLKENIYFIKGLSEYITYMIRDLTQICKFNNCFNESSDYNIVKKEIKIKEILKFAYQILKTLLITNDNKKFIKPFFRYDSLIDDIFVYSDEIRLKQILINFISNAVKFTLSGSITLEASVIQVEKRIKISILDSGVGIKDDNKEKLFNEFYMIKNNENGQNDLNLFGSGLGLSININLAKKLGHKIDYDSVYGKGSCFYIELDYSSIPRNISYKDSTKVRLSKPNNIITQNIFEKSKSYKNSHSYMKNPYSYSVQEISNFNNQISISVASDDKITCRLMDERLEFNYPHSPDSDSKRDISILDKSQNISSFSKYIQGNYNEFI